LPAHRSEASFTLDRERLWYEFLRAGFSAQDLKRVVAYLQKGIRASRRNVGALKLFKLLQLDRFEEDLNISNAFFVRFCRHRTTTHLFGFGA
jgi:hypothetical protein